MKALTYVFLLFFHECLASNLSILHPDGAIDDIWHVSSMDSNQLFEFNKQILGLKSDGKNEALFKRPKVLAVLRISGIHDFQLNGTDLHFPSVFHTMGIGKHLKKTFGNDWEHATVNATAITGTQIADYAMKMHEESSIKIGDENMRNEIVNLYKLTAAIAEHDFKNKNTVDFYNIQLDSTDSQHLPVNKQLEESNEIKNAILEFHEALKTAYGNGVIMEIYTHVIWGPGHRQKKLVMYNMKMVMEKDDGVLSLIVYLVSFSFVFAVVAVLISFYESADMGKKSIAYRLSPGRIKKD